jgi:hypothetical protein
MEEPIMLVVLKYTYHHGDSQQRSGLGEEEFFLGLRFVPAKTVYGCQFVVPPPVGIEIARKN